MGTAEWWPLHHFFVFFFTYSTFPSLIKHTFAIYSSFPLPLPHCGRWGNEWAAVWFLAVYQGLTHSTILGNIKTQLDMALITWYNWPWGLEHRSSRGSCQPQWFCDTVIFGEIWCLGLLHQRENKKVFMFLENLYSANPCSHMFHRHLANIKHTYKTAIFCRTIFKANILTSKSINENYSNTTDIL